MITFFNLQCVILMILLFIATALEVNNFALSAVFILFSFKTIGKVRFLWQKIKYKRKLTGLK